MNGVSGIGEFFVRIVSMARKFDAVAVDSIFRCGRTLPFAIEALQRTFYPLGIQFAVVEDDFCSADKTAKEVAEYFNGKTIDKIRSEFITNRQNHFEEGTFICKRKKNTTPCAYHAVPEKMLMMVAMDQIHHLVSTMCEEEKLVKDMMRGSNLDSARSIKMKENSILFRIRQYNYLA